MATENQSKANNCKGFSKKRKHYIPHNKPVKKGAYPLRPGVQGFFITCDGGREHQASHEAINVIESFFEELVQGPETISPHAEIANKSLNKKTKFVYSDSSEDEEENGEDDDTGKIENTVMNSKDENSPKCNVISDENLDLLNKENLGNQNKEKCLVGQMQQNKSDEENLGQIQQNKGDKENPKNSGDDYGVSGEPPNKKQCVETSSMKSPNLTAGKMEEKSVDKLIEAELAVLGDKSKRRFSKLESGCNGLVFVQMRRRDGDPSPKDIVQYMMTSLASTRKHVSRFMLRVLPIEMACYASEEEITKAIKPLIAQYFPQETQNPHKFAVLYDARANTGIDRMKIINAVAKSVALPHKVDLSNPDINIVVQIVKTVCLIGVVEKYKELAKYNLRQLTSTKA